MSDRDRLAALLKAEGWEPDSNVCRCGHRGGVHTTWGNWCLICLPPKSDTFASFSDTELWERAADRLIAAGVGFADARLREALDVVPDLVAVAVCGLRDSGGVSWNEARAIGEKVLRAALGEEPTHG